MERSRPPFLAAADALEGGAPLASLPGPIRALLEAFGLAPESHLPADRLADARLLRLADRIGPLFRLPAALAPALVALGAEVDLAAIANLPPADMPPGSASGVGLTPLDALRACLGEAAELLSAVETPADRAAMRPAPPQDAARDVPLERLLAALCWPADTSTGGWLPAIRLTDGAAVWVPGELALRTPPGRRVLPDPPWPPSLGCAAGPTLDHAALRALEELIERDALALWWRGGRRGLAIPLESPAASRAASMIGRLRRDRSDRRRSWLLDITTENGVPVVAALSCAPDGFGVCGGFAARANGLADAAVAAVLELAQMELAYALAAAKARERGEAALNPQDRAHLRRHVGIDAGRAVLLHPALPPGPRPPTLPPPASEAATPAEALSALVRRLEALGQAPLRLDLTRPEVCVPVVRMLSPGLEKESGSGMGARLRRAIAENGAGWTPDLAFA